MARPSRRCRRTRLCKHHQVATEHFGQRQSRAYRDVLIQMCSSNCQRAARPARPGAFACQLCCRAAQIRTRRFTSASHRAAAARDCAVHRRLQDRPGGRGEQLPVRNGREFRPVDALDAWLTAVGVTKRPIFREVDRMAVSAPGRRQIDR